MTPVTNRRLMTYAHLSALQRSVFMIDFLKRPPFKQLSPCTVLGMKVIMCDDRVTARREPVLDEEDYRARFARSLEEFGNHPAVAGFDVGDEPDAPEASTFFAVARIQREMAPHLMPYLNLLPWFDWIGEREIW